VVVYFVEVDRIVDHLSLNFLFYNYVFYCYKGTFWVSRDHRGYDRMVVGFTTPCVIIAYHH